MKLSELAKAHSMTLKDGAMVCKAGDWPDSTDAMPETEDMLSKERLDYALERVIGHEAHVAEILDAEAGRIYAKGYEKAQQEQWDADHPYGRDGLS